MSKKSPAIIKREKRSDWEKSSYVPEENVIIIKDNDDGTISLSIGDGETNVNDLPDILGNAKPRSTARVNGETGTLTL
jgi:hypothetical protein